MPYYRLYSVDAFDGHITDVRHFDADSDAIAIASIQSDLSGVSRELWNQGRKVADFTPKTLPALKLGAMATLIIPTLGWRWNPLKTHCQLVD